MCACATAYLWTSENDLGELVLSFYHRSWGLYSGLSASFFIHRAISHPVVYFLVHNIIGVFFLSGHGTSFNIDCNVCSCFAGNLVCFGRPCLSEHSSDDDRTSFTGSHRHPEPVLQGPSFLALIFLLGIARIALTANVHSYISVKSECNIPSSLTLCFPLFVKEPICSPIEAV